MKLLNKLVAGVSAVGSALYFFSLPVWADPPPAISGTVSLCPTGQFSSLCNTGLNVTRVGQFIINFLLVIGFFAALVFLIYGGIRWITSGGDKEGTAKAKATVTAALIGLVIVLASWIVLSIVVSTLFGGLSVTNLTVPNL